MTPARPALVAETVGTAMLLTVVVGSGIAVEALGADPAVALFVHAATVGLALAALIAGLGPVSGAHFNPAVTVGFLLRRAIDRRTAAMYVVAQVVGGLAGTVLAHLSFGRGLAAWSPSIRNGPGLWLSEMVFTTMLVALILLMVHFRRESQVPAAVGAWVGAAIFATSSTGFANPAVTVARTVTDTFTGIHPTSVPMFLLAQMSGAFVAVALVRSISQPEGAHL